MSCCFSEVSRGLARSVCLGVCLLVVPAATASGQFLTEDEAVRIAVENNPQVMAADARVSYAGAGVWQSTSNMLPTVSASCAKIRNREEVAFEFDMPEIPGLDIPDMGKQIIMPLEMKTFSVDVTQPLFTGGALYQARKIASRSLDAARSDLMAVRQSVALEARKAYYNLIKSQGLLRIAQETEAQVTESKRVVDKMFEVGLVPRSDVLRVDASLAGVRQSMQQAEEGVELARAQLNIILNRPMDAAVSVEPTVEIVPFDRPLKECTETALANRPDLHQMSANVDIARRGVKAQMGSLLPSVALVYHYEWSDLATAFAPQDSWRLMGVLSYDLPLGFGNVARVRGARAQAREVERGLEMLTDGIGLEVKAAWSSLSVARKGLEFAETQLASATENRRVMDRRYREGDATYLDLLDGDTLLIQAKVNNLSTRIDYRIAVASLRKAMGEEE
ncbi:MAG: TolC family protein [Candidatus Eisenbacteria sp.]|nr:TolC family protein [Candidatus Eisenbacteria bacterium]